MSCETNRPRLQAYLDGILARDDAEGVERHLAGCEACRTEKERLEKVMSAVGGLTPLKAPAGFKKAFMERLTQGQASEGPQRGQPAFPRLRRMIPLSLAASFIIVGLTAYLVYFSQKGDGERAPVTGRPEDVAMKREGRGEKGMKTFDAEYQLENKQPTDGLYKGLSGSEAPAAEMVADRDKAEGLKIVAEDAELAQATERLKEEESSMVPGRRSGREQSKGPGKGPNKGPSKGIPESNFNTVLVMGSNSWSIPDTLLAQAESRGIVVSGMEPGLAGPAGPATAGGKAGRTMGDEKGRGVQEMRTRVADKGEGEPVEAAKLGDAAPSAFRNYLEEGIEWEYAVFEVDNESFEIMISDLKSSKPDAILGGRTGPRPDEVKDSIQGSMAQGKEKAIGHGKLENPVMIYGPLEEDDRDGVSNDLADLPEVGRWFAGARFKAYDESPAREEEKKKRPLVEAAAESKTGERRKIILVYPKKRIAKGAEK